jgi:hypothetical protein
MMRKLHKIVMLSKSARRELSSERGTPAPSRVEARIFAGPDSLQPSGSEGNLRKTI